MESNPITSWHIDGKTMETVRDFIFLGSKRVSWTARKSNQSILKEISPEYSLEGLMLKFKLQYFGHWCEELMLLNCGVGKDSWKSSLDCKEIQPVYPKGDQSWVFIGRTDGEAETPILWPPDVKSWLIGKDPDPGKESGQEKGMMEDEMVGCHHRYNGHGFG